MARGRWEEAPEAAEAQGAWELTGWTWDRLLDGDLPFYEVVDDQGLFAAEDPRRAVLALVQLRAAFPAGALGWARDGGGWMLAAVRTLLKLWVWWVNS